MGKVSLTRVMRELCNGERRFSPEVSKQWENLNSIKIDENAKKLAPLILHLEFLYEKFKLKNQEITWQRKS